jgi:ribose transport system permease protein
VIDGITSEYRVGNANNTTVPDSLSNVVFEQFLGISKAFWFVFVIMLLVGVVLRSSAPGRRFQAVGANRRAAWMAGIKVRSYVVTSYVMASVAGGLAAIILSAIVISPGATPGDSYLLGPVAAVVLAGASLTGGLASPLSTWLAAFFVVVLNQMLKVLGLPVNAQPIVFGAAIVLGMLISGDRIAELIGRLLVLRPGLRMMDATVAERPEPATQPGGPAP